MSFTKDAINEYKFSVYKIKKFLQYLMYKEGFKKIKAVSTLSKR